MLTRRSFCKLAGPGLWPLYQMGFWPLYQKSHAADSPHTMDAFKVRALASSTEFKTDNGITATLAPVAGLELLLPDQADIHRKAREFISAQIMDRQIKAMADTPVDRHKRYAFSKLLDISGKDLLPNLVASGWLVVWPYPGADPDILRGLYKAEDSARKAGRGLWNLSKLPFPRFAADQPETIRSYQGFGIIYGTVTAARKTNSQTYVNFGAEWRKDVSLGLARGLKSLPLFPDIQNIETDLPGRKIEVRGYIRAYNGPFIDIMASGAIRPYAI